MNPDAIEAAEYDVTISVRLKGDAEQINHRIDKALDRAFPSDRKDVLALSWEVREDAPDRDLLSQTGQERDAALADRLYMAQRWDAAVEELERRAQGYAAETGIGDAYRDAANYLREQLGGGSGADKAAGEPSRAAALGPGDGVAGGASRSRRSCSAVGPTSTSSAVGDDRAPADRRMLERLYVLICGGSEKDWEQRCTEAALILAEALQGQVVESKSASVPTVLSVPASEPGASGDPGVGTAGAERVESPSYERPGASGDNPALGSDRAPGACECCGKPVAACLCSDCRAADDRAPEWPEEIRLVRSWDFGTALNYAVEPKGSPPPAEEHRYYVPRSQPLAVLQELQNWVVARRNEFERREALLGSEGARRAKVREYNAGKVEALLRVETQIALAIEEAKTNG